MKFKYRLVEQEEGGEETTNKKISTYNLVLIPTNGTIADTIAAFEKIDNYGSYVSNLRNTKVDVEKAVTDYFGPSQPFAKKKAEKERGKPFPPKTKAAVDDFIKTVSSKPKLLKWKVVNDTLVFPPSGNPTKNITEKIIATVMDNAKIKYKLENKEALDENSQFNISPTLAFKIYDALADECETIKDHFPNKSSFFTYLNNKIK